MAITTFERVEQKYLISQSQKDSLCSLLSAHMKLDSFCKNESTYMIRNIYLDTDDNYLIRTSLFKPVYKEKLRLRKYTGQEGLFIEIKKKYQGVVSKRRVEISEEELERWLNEGKKPERDDYLSKQIVNELDYLLKRYQVHKSVYIAYDRLGFFDTDNPELRVTFDSNLRYRKGNLSWEDTDTKEIIPKDQYILEIKDCVNLPLWLTSALAELEIVKKSFSKYGTEYMKELEEESKDE